MPTTAPTTMRVTRGLRPVRIGFLVDPGDRASIRLAMSLAACLWGGTQCPLIPVMRRRPQWWPSDVDGGNPTAREIVDRYLTAYDPDRLVSLLPGAVDGISKDQLLDLGEFEPNRYSSYRQHSNLLQAIAHLHRSRFRFQERLPPQHVFHAPESSSPLGDALLGRLTGHVLADHVSRSLQSTLGASPKHLTVDLLIRSQVDLQDRPVLTTPLKFGSDRLGVAATPTFFAGVYLCSQSTWDAIEFWNLRAAGVNVFACPTYHFNGRLFNLVQSLPGADLEVFGATRLDGRTRLDAEEIASELFGRELRPPPYPWLENRRLRDQHHVWKQSEHSLDEEGTAQIPLLEPGWTEDTWLPLRFGAWVNDIALQGDMYGREAATLIPHDLRSQSLFLPALLGASARLRGGAISVVSHLPDASAHVVLPRSGEMFRVWLAERGLSSEISDPGRTMLEILRRIGGLFYAQDLLRENTLALLERGTRRHHLEAQHVHFALRQDAGSGWPHLLERLVDAGALRSAPLIRCANCGQQNWVAIDRLSERFACERCLEQTPFPHAHPPKRWAYRPIGPFAVPRMAAGSYSAILALAALNPEHGPGTWVPSTRIAGFGELDFAMWRRSDSLYDFEARPDLVLGEAKSYDDFLEQDVNRMLELRVKLGTGFVCFATMRSEFRESERRRFTALAREMKSMFGEVPLIVLTGHELWNRSLNESLNRQFGLDSEQGFGRTDMALTLVSGMTRGLHLTSARARGKFILAMRSIAAQRAATATTRPG